MLRRISLFISLLWLAACAPSSTDLQQPQGVASLDAAGNRPGLDRIAHAVRDGAVRKGWSVTSEQPGAVFASVSSGGHSADVRIEYNEGGWVIQHVSSSPGLKYDPNYRGREVIHQRYNLWVRHLNRSIENALRRLMRRAPAPPPVTAGAEATPPSGAPATGTTTVPPAPAAPAPATAAPAPDASEAPVPAPPPAP